jgi:hypothetical protein
VKTIVRLLCLVLMITGWAVAALCLHIVRTPDPNNAGASKLVVIPKARLGINDTYVDARAWTASDVGPHADLIRRILEAGKAEQFRFLTDPKSNEAPQDQLSDALKADKASEHQRPQPATRTGAHSFSMRTASDTSGTASAADDADRNFNFSISY